MPKMGETRDSWSHKQHEERRRGRLSVQVKSAPMSYMYVPMGAYEDDALRSRRSLVIMGPHHDFLVTVSRRV